VNPSVSAPPGGDGVGEPPGRSGRGRAATVSIQLRRMIESYVGGAVRQWRWLAVGAAAAIGLAYARRDPGTRVLVEMPRHPVLSEPQIRDSDIVFYRHRAERDPTGAMDLARLARLYMQRARETGNYTDVIRAESAARTSLHNRAPHNASAAQILAASLLSEHRFGEALDVERRLVEYDPTRVAYRAAYGEMAFELGRYDEARATFDSLRSRAQDLSVAPRLARWEEIEGHTEAARHWLRVTRDQAVRRPDLPREQIAWIWLRSGDLELRAGRPDVAASDYQQGLAAHPDDYRVLAAIAHLDAVEHQWRLAIAAGERAIVSNLDPATLGTLSDAYGALGDTAKAVEYARVMEVAVSRQPGSYHRAWSLFLLDHGRRVPEVLAKARTELATRHDIYGWDVLAWALYRSGRITEAESAMTHALAEGTQDAMLLFHAGMIEKAADHWGAARTLLARALAVNPYFHPIQPDSARAVLRELAAAGGVPIQASPVGGQ
jgi:tetratricopeptide (TPR) repeat protein